MSFLKVFVEVNDIITIFAASNNDNVAAADLRKQKTTSKMNTAVIKTEKELKYFVSKNRKNITNINDVQFGELYPMLEVTNRHASFYDVETQGNKFLCAPFTVQFK